MPRKNALDVPTHRPFGHRDRRPAARIHVHPDPAVAPVRKPMRARVEEDGLTRAELVLQLSRSTELLETVASPGHRFHEHLHVVVAGLVAVGAVGGRHAADLCFFAVAPCCDGAQLVRGDACILDQRAQGVCSALVATLSTVNKMRYRPPLRRSTALRRRGILRRTVPPWTY